MNEFKKSESIEDVQAKKWAEYSVQDLLTLEKQIKAEEEVVKIKRRTLDKTLVFKYSEKAFNFLKEDGRDSGTIRFEDEDYIIRAEFPKKVAWDQNVINSVIDKIPEEDRKNCIKTTYAIDERKYLKSSEEFKSLLEPARSLTIGKQTFEIISK